MKSLMIIFLTLSALFLDLHTNYHSIQYEVIGHVQHYDEITERWVTDPPSYRDRVAVVSSLDEDVPYICEREVIEMDVTQFRFSINERRIIICRPYDPDGVERMLYEYRRIL